MSPDQQVQQTHVLAAWTRRDPSLERAEGQGSPSSALVLVERAVRLLPCWAGSCVLRGGPRKILGGAAPASHSSPAPRRMITVSSILQLRRSPRPLEARLLWQVRQKLPQVPPRNLRRNK